MRGGPTVAQLEAVNGPGAKQPIRVYAGLQSADTVQGRADLVLAELKRTGAFDRKVLVVATTTGMGFLDSRGTDPLEYLWNGDTAIAGVQYSYLPSWISVLADQEAVVDTSRTVFETVRQYWATLPAGERPELYLYGLSLGSMGVESVLTSVNIVNEPVDGALMVGPAVRQRDARPPRGATATPAHRHPCRSTRRGARCASPTSRAASTRSPGPGGRPASPTCSTRRTRSSSSPATWRSTGRSGSPTASAAPTSRPPWAGCPLVTMWQVLLDMPGAGNVPTGLRPHVLGPREPARPGPRSPSRPTGPARAEQIGAALGNR